MITSFAIDLTGEWIGEYASRLEEVVRVVQQGDQVEAVKISGNEFVPAGEVTWRANLVTGLGEGQIAEYEHHNPRFVPGRLLVTGSERICFRWDGFGEVEYRRDD